jgi:hypothetical protein
MREGFVPVEPVEGTGSVTTAVAVKEWGVRKRTALPRKEKREAVNEQ